MATRSCHRSSPAATTWNQGDTFVDWSALRSCQRDGRRRGCHNRAFRLLDCVRTQHCLAVRPLSLSVRSRDPPQAGPNASGPAALKRLGLKQTSSSSRTLHPGPPSCIARNLGRANQMGLAPFRGTPEPSHLTGELTATNRRSDAPPGGATSSSILPDPGDCVAAIQVNANHPKWLV